MRESSVLCEQGQRSLSSAINRQINRCSMGLERQDIDDRTGRLSFLEMAYQTLHQKHWRACVHCEQMDKQRSICLCNRASVAEPCRTNQAVQPAKLIDGCGYNPGGRVLFLEISGYESGLRSQFQYFGGDFLTALCVTISKTNSCRARARGLKRNRSSHTLRRPCDEQDFVVNSNLHLVSL